MSTLRVNTIQDAAGSGTPAINGLAKAWVNFNGTGTVAIRAALNVSSITDNGTGDYTVNFTTAMPDANFSLVGTSNSDPAAAPQYFSGNFSVASNNTVAPTTTTARVSVWGGGGSARDNTYINVAIFR